MQPRAGSFSVHTAAAGTAAPAQKAAHTIADTVTTDAVPTDAVTGAVGGAVVSAIPSRPQQAARAGQTIDEGGSGGRQPTEGRNRGIIVILSTLLHWGWQLYQVAQQNEQVVNGLYLWSRNSEWKI